MGDVRKLADQFRFKINDYLDEPNDPLAQELKQAADRLMSAVKAGKDNEYVHEIAKSVEQVVYKCQNSTIMDGNHADDLLDRIRDVKDASR